MKTKASFVEAIRQWQTRIQPGLAGQLAAGLLALAVLGGCGTTPTRPITTQDTQPAPTVTIREGDMVKIAFPGAPSMNIAQQVRRDGKIALPLKGEVVAVNKTPAELEKEVLAIYEPELVQKEVMVTLEAATYPVYLSGAVLRPGKVVTDRPLTILEAIMEAGGHDPMKANLKEVMVIRQEEGVQKIMTVNVKEMMDGKVSNRFYLKPSDVVVVKEKFKLF
jgi:polysaccharide export outer membrane protein